VVNGGFQYLVMKNVVVQIIEVAMSLALMKKGAPERGVKEHLPSQGWAILMMIDITPIQAPLQQMRCRSDQYLCQ
jgi:hypothetical protein